MRLKAACIDLMPVYTAKSPEFRQSVHDANQRTLARHQQDPSARALPEKEAIHKKLIHSDTVSEHNLSVTTHHSLFATKLMAPLINPRQVVALYSGHQTHEGPHLLQVHPGRDQVHFCQMRNLYMTTEHTQGFWHGPSSSSGIRQRTCATRPCWSGKSEITERNCCQSTYQLRLR